MIGILAERGSYSIDALMAWSQSSFAHIEDPDLRPKAPYNLEKVRSGRCAVVASGFLAALRPRVAVEELVSRLRRSFDEVVFWDHADPFQLDLGANELALFDRVLKVNGLYKDPDLYNYEVGAPSPSGNWTQKKTLRPGPRYAPDDLAALRLGPPCFLSSVPKVRSRTRTLYQGWLERSLKDRVDDVADVWVSLTRLRAPQRTAHVAGTLSHVQRADALRRIRQAGVPFFGGITSVPPFIAGFDGRFGMNRLDPQARARVEAELREEGLMMAPLARPNYVASMLSCKAVVSITGYGEICFRMAEAWVAGRVLVCQDLSHVQTGFPLEPGRNVVYCRPDLSDLAAILDDIECHWPRYRQIAEQGRQDFQAWSRRAPEMIGETLACLVGSSDIPGAKEEP